MIRNSQAASSTVLPLIVVMEVVSSKGFGLMNSTLFVVGQSPIEKKNKLKYSFFIAFEFIKKEAIWIR
jgi:hypothetical protein